MKNNGFTLIEAVLTLSLLAGGLMGILTLYQRNVVEANQIEQTLQADYLSQEKMEQIVQDKKYNLYAFVTAANYLASENLTAQGFKGFIRTIQIREVDPNNLSITKAGTGYKEVTVAVQVPGEKMVTLKMLLTKWGEP